MQDVNIPTDSEISVNDMILTIRYFSDTVIVIQTALELHQKSPQAFDITIDLS